MKLKPMSAAALVLTAILLAGASTAAAGDKQRHRWEGFAIGLGTAIIGQHILSHGHPGAVAYAFPPPPPVHYQETHVYHHGPQYAPPPRHYHRPSKIVVHHHYDNRHRGYGNSCTQRRPKKEIHHHYHHKGPKHSRAQYHHR